MKHIAQDFLASLLVMGLWLLPVAAQSQGQPDRPSQQPQDQPAQQQSNPPASTAPQPTAVPAPAAPQQAPQHRTHQTPPLRTSSDLVRIDVEVTDRSGAPIKGLRADQFSVTDNGKPQPITTFLYSDIEAVERAAPETQTPVTIPIDPATPLPEDAVSNAVRDRRLLVLFFDLTSMETDDLIRAHDAAQKFIDKQMTAADLVSIVVFGNRLSVWADFTNDRKVLSKAVAQLTANASSQLADNLYAAAQNGEYDVQEYTGAAYTADETEFNVFNTDQKLAAVEGLANVLDAIPGRKAIVQFSGGITQTGEENRTELRSATDAANRSDVSIYSIDARGLFAAVPGGDATTNAATGNSIYTGASVYHQTDQRQDSRDTLGTLSEDTGGHAFFDLGDLSEAFPQIEKEYGGYYLIGYTYAANLKHDGAWHSVHVKVNAPGAHVRFRNGYYAPRDFQHLEKEDREQQLADSLHSENPVVELAVAVETSMFRLSDQQAYIPIAAKLSSSTLEWAQKHGQHQLEFDFAAEVHADSNNQVVVHLRDTVTVHLDEQRYQQVNQSSLLYQGGVILSPGSYSLKFVAREDETGKIGTFEEPIVVPPLPADKITLSSVLLSSQLVPLEKSSEVQTKAQGVRAAKLSNSPLEMDGARIVPSVTRFFTQQQTLYVFFQAYYPEKLQKSESFDPHSLRASLLFFRNGFQIKSAPLLSPTEINAKSRTASFRISLPLAQLPTGRYTVQAIVVAPGTQHSAFGRSYLALTQPAAAPGANPTAPPTAPSATPPTPQPNP
ncbi:MAG TPA: VWA domain-containing protein [Candidatus Acidoferrales bacterium]|nr:VWA domain-containing protein [Candidatus Acidoferrales bacterium]